ncbi:MAG: aspartate kinase [Oscillospiraceae bacterium]|jgi:aspartate kinase|nr:aspartate kinase [Oscillospiraceae bacterium]
MSLIVKKFGGTSVAGKERMLNAAEIIKKTYLKNNKIVVVVSAQGNTTDELLEKAWQININPSKRELDVLLCAGEQISMALLAIALEKLGIEAISLTGWQAGFKTCKSYGNARIEGIYPERILKELSKNKVVIVAGFQGINDSEDLTTMGRGGSDTSAVALAAALNADECRIYTDVDGVYTANPHVVPNAEFLEIVSYGDMIKLASLGTQVLNKRSVEIAQKYGVEISVLSSLNRKNPQTTVKEVESINSKTIKGIALDNSLFLIHMDKSEKKRELFERFSEEKITVSNVICNKNEINFIINKSHLNVIYGILSGINFNINSDISKISVVGLGKKSHMEIADQMLEALKDISIEFVLIEDSISVIVSMEESEIAVRRIHDKFFTKNCVKVNE